MKRVFFLVLVLGTIGDFAFSQCTCTTGCSSLTIITMPFTKDGAAELCFQSSNIGAAINSWNMAALVINGVDFTNKWADCSSVPAAASDGYYYIYYKGLYSYSHFEATGTCSGGTTTAPTTVPAETNPPSDTQIATAAPTTPGGDTLGPTDAPTDTPAPTVTPAPTTIPTATPAGVTPAPTDVSITPAPTDTATATPGSGSPNIPWDWAHVFGTGQSLAVGEQGNPVSLTTQPYNNLKLSTGSLAWPVDPNNSSLTMVPLIEPVGRLASTYPSSWPTNIAGETPHSAMGNQITSLVQSAFSRDYISVQGNVGENGQCLIYLVKNATQSGVNGRAFAATLIEVQATKRLATAAGKTYGVAAVTLTHGECDSGNTSYESQVYQLWSDYNTDIKAITGQTQDILMIASQQNSCGDNSASTVAMWKLGVDYPASCVCSGPKYQYQYAADKVHLTTAGYEQLGEKYGQIYYERIVLGNSWAPLQPISATRSGNTITVQFHVPVAPLVWDSTFQTPHQSTSEWTAGKGFEVYTSTTSHVTISSVAISGDTVVITCASDPGANCRVDYAMAQNSSAMSTPFAGTVRWGLLRDSDPFVGSTTGKTQPNWCVAFQMTVQ